MVWETDGSVLVKAEEFADFSRREMEAFDRLPPYRREQYRENGQDITTSAPSPFYRF